MSSLASPQLLLYQLSLINWPQLLRKEKGQLDFQWVVGQLEEVLGRIHPFKECHCAAYSMHRQSLLAVVANEVGHGLLLGWLVVKR